MKYIWLAVPIVLIVVLAGALYLNQPKTIPTDDLSYVNVGGDEYLDEEYITPDEELTGERELINEPSGQNIPVNLSDCESSEFSNKETCYLIYSVASGDEQGCESISDQTTRDDCIARIAQLRAEPAVCEKIKVGKSQCIVDAAIEKGDSSLCEMGSADRAQCYRAFSSKDYTMCAESFDKRHCNDAIAENDSKLCENIETYSSFCYYTIATNTKSPSLCSKAGTSAQSCYFRIALETNNPAICENLSETRDNCIAWIAFNTNNKELCYEAGSEAQSCIEDIEAQ
ncbi:MAG TPA: hypothetical protein VJG83_00640 [archaeon]|nr:hypothetical protein [archaeon]